MSKMYAVMRRGYEYNDEGYDSSEYGNIVKVYSTHAAAAKAVRDFYIQDVRKNNMYMYNTFRDMKYSVELEEVLTRMGHKWNNDWYYEDMDSLFTDLSKSTEEDIMIFVDSLREPLYYIVEVEVGS